MAGFGLFTFIELTPIF